MLERNQVTIGLAGKYVDTYAFADGGLEVRWQGLSLPYPSLRSIGIFGLAVEGSHIENKGLFGPVGAISAEKVWAHESGPNPCRYR
jgi:hypothetical protein